MNEINLFWKELPRKDFFYFYFISGYTLTVIDRMSDYVEAGSRKKGANLQGPPFLFLFFQM
ncbi:hypothetical protein A9Q84_17290 [Halobacteriovorax marinus]|uniref:Uncharacterized protein n=1 Tax=Halobacteriovorax marinus TaxID=97084 RepID=A0A1Y5F3P5_9BACT|nr:hypothetical protein A9Q84_17290 [Halobacteriovorax marinus]